MAEEEKTEFAGSLDAMGRVKFERAGATVERLKGELENMKNSKVSRFLRQQHGDSFERLIDSMSKEAGDSIDSAVRATETEEETPLEENPNCVTFVATIGNQVSQSVCVRD